MNIKRQSTKAKYAISFSFYPICANWLNNNELIIFPSISLSFHQPVQPNSIDSYFYTFFLFVRWILNKKKRSLILTKHLIYQIFKTRLLKEFLSITMKIIFQNWNVNRKISNSVLQLENIFLHFDVNKTNIYLSNSENKKRQGFYSKKRKWEGEK